MEWNQLDIIYMSREKTKTQVPKLVIDDKDINDPHKIRIGFNSYFTEIASEINIPRVSFRDLITLSHTNFELIASTVELEFGDVRKVCKGNMNLSRGYPTLRRLQAKMRPVEPA